MPEPTDPLPPITFSAPRMRPHLLIRLVVRFLRWRTRPVGSILLTLLLIASASVGSILFPNAARAAERGAGFGTWAPVSAYGWHGSMIVGGVHTYCITPGAPAPTGASVDHGVSASAAGLSPQQLTGINLLVSTYGQTDDPVQAAAVGWAVKAIANWNETLHAFGYPGDSLAGAIHWTLSALAPEHDLAVQQRAVAYYDEATRVAGGVTSASGALVFTTHPADPSSGTVRVDATVAATGTISLVGATFADTGSATRENAVTGAEYAIHASATEPGRPYSVSGTGRFSAGFAAAVRHFSTLGGQDTAGPAGATSFDVAGADAAPRIPPFAPSISTAVAARYAGGGSYVDDVTFRAGDTEWPRGEHGEFLPVTARATVYRTATEPAPGDPVPADDRVAGTLELVADAGPDQVYRVVSAWEMVEPGFYTAVWRVSGADQSPAVAAHTRPEYAWVEAFAERSQVTVVPAIATAAQPEAAPGETLTDTVHVTGGVPSDGLRLVAALYRAASGIAPADTCVPQNLVWESDAMLVTEAGSYRFTSPGVSDAGTYFWQERATDAAGASVHVGVCGIDNETSRVVDAPRAGPPALAATGLGADRLRTPTAIAVVLLTAGLTVVTARGRARTIERGSKHPA